MSQKHIFFQKNTLCHSFRIIVIPSVLLSFLPDYCHSFHITVIPSVLVSFLPNIVIPSKSMSFLLYYCHSFRISVIPSKLLSFLPNIVIPSELLRELQILTSSKSFPPVAIYANLKVNLESMFVKQKKNVTKY